MSCEAKSESIADRELVLTRLIDAPRRNVFRAWTEPELMKRWFTPPPWKTIHVENDVRSGGTTLVVMQGPDGQEMRCPGIYLEVVKDEKIVFTDAFVRAWEPSNKSFMVGTLTFADEGGKTRYPARVQHWSVADREAHEQMGFHVGWGIAADQLEALAKTL